MYAFLLLTCASMDRWVAGASISQHPEGSNLDFCRKGCSSKLQMQHYATLSPQFRYVCEKEEDISSETDNHGN